MRTRYIIAVSLAVCSIMYVLEQIIAVDYSAKTAAKIVLFAAVPFIHFMLSGKTDFTENIRPGNLRKSAFRVEILLGAASFGGIICLYFLLGSFIDFGAVARELGAKSKIDATNFPFVGTYIVFGNSFLEELFFRGFVFLSLYMKGLRKLAYIYSSVLFGAYHVAIIGTWVSPLLLLLAVLGLALVGACFDWLDSRSGSIVNSWIVHIAADAAVVMVGMRMFDLI